MLSGGIDKQHRSVMCYNNFDVACFREHVTHFSWSILEMVNLTAAFPRFQWRKGEGDGHVKLQLNQIQIIESF